MDADKLHKKDGENNEDQTGDGGGDNFFAGIEFVGDAGRSSDDEDAVEDEKESHPAAKADENAKKTFNKAAAFSIERNAAQSGIDSFVVTTAKKSRPGFWALRCGVITLVYIVTTVSRIIAVARAIHSERA